MSLLSIAFVLFLIMDPIGNISCYLTMIKEFDFKKQRKILFRELLIALGVMLCFNFIGEYIFQFLEFSETTVRITSGVILFLIAIKILFTSSDSLRANLPKGEPYIFPLAVPLIAGPALIATIMLFARLESSLLVMISAIILAWGLSGLILFFAAPIKKLLGENGLMACERLIGMILVIMAVQRLLDGILLFWSTHPNYA